MNFNVKRLTISVSHQSRIIFKEIDKIRPNNLSFSLFMSHIAEEYLKHNSSVIIPENELSFKGDLQEWYSVINSAKGEEFIALQDGIRRIQRMIDNKVDRLLC